MRFNSFQGENSSLGKTVENLAREYKDFIMTSDEDYDYYISGLAFGKINYRLVLGYSFGER